MFACLHWVATNAVPQPIEGQPYQPPDGVWPTANGVPDTAAESQPAETQNASGLNGTSTESVTGVDYDSAMKNYKATLRELAQDLVIKEQQIEMLAKELPGLDRSQNDQEKRIKELEDEARALEVQARDAGVLRESLIKRVEETMFKVRRV